MTLKELMDLRAVNSARGDPIVRRCSSGPARSGRSPALGSDGWVRIYPGYDLDKRTLPYIIGAGFTGRRHAAEPALEIVLLGLVQAVKPALADIACAPQMRRATTLRPYSGAGAMELTVATVRPARFADAEKQPARIAPLWRAVIETGFIIFLYYSNLLMGEYTHSNNPDDKLLPAALWDIFTLDNFIIAVVSALIGYMVVEYLRTKV
jgi:hypothetical protein